MVRVKVYAGLEVLFEKKFKPVYNKAEQTAHFRFFTDEMTNFTDEFKNHLSTIMKQYTIEPASENDYPRLLSIWEAAVRATHHFLTEAHITFYKQQIPELYFPSVSLFIAKGDDKSISGFLGISPDNIEMLFVDPDHFGKGVGKQLTRFAIEEKNITKVDVNEQNPQALGFYQSMGFVIRSKSERDGENNPFPILHLELERD